MRVLAVIPARGGSKGVPGKNIKLLGGKPLMQYTIDVALQCLYIDKVIVSTDDDQIIACAEKLGVEVPFKRPAHLAQDDTPTLPVILHALEFLKENNECFDAVCLLQVTTPFRTVDFLNSAIRSFMETETDSLISVQKVPDHYNPHWTFTVDEQNHLKIATGDQNIISRRQELPIAYHRDGSVYLTKTAVLLQDLSLYGNAIAYKESDSSFYVNIDTIADWDRAENMLVRYNKM